MKLEKMPSRKTLTLCIILDGEIFVLMEQPYEYDLSELQAQQSQYYNHSQSAQEYSSNLFGKVL